MNTGLVAAIITYILVGMAVAFYVAGMVYEDWRRDESFGMFHLVFIAFTIPFVAVLYPFLIALSSGIAAERKKRERE